MADYHKYWVDLAKNKTFTPNGGLIIESSVGKLHFQAFV